MRPLQVVEALLQLPTDPEAVLELGAEYRQQGGRGGGVLPVGLYHTPFFDYLILGFRIPKP